MHVKFFAILALGCCVPACDKANRIVQSAKAAVKAKRGEPASTGGPADPALQKLVDQSADGVLFRKDLPFPALLSVTVKSSDTIDGRYFQSSEMGKNSASLQAVEVTVVNFEREGSEVRARQLESTLTPLVGDAQNSDKPPTPLKSEGPGKPITFRRSGQAWRCVATSDFAAMNRWKPVEKNFDVLLAEHGLEPRAMWFGKHRFKMGETLKVTGGSLPMLVPGRGAGSLALKLESLETIHGHPCAVFSVSGEISCRQHPELSGDVEDQDVTISSGKIWISLLHPVVMREDYDAIITSRSVSRDGQAARFQGALKRSVTREWKAGP
jgi:hypothetical protein